MFHRARFQLADWKHHGGTVENMRGALNGEALAEYDAWVSSMQRLMTKKAKAIAKESKKAKAIAKESKKNKPMKRKAKAIAKARQTSLDRWLKLQV